MAAKLRQLKLERIDLVDAPANPGSHVVLMKRDVKKDAPGIAAVHVDKPIEKDAPTKTEDGVSYPAAAYAYVPDAQTSSTWKLRLWESPSTKETAAQVGRAVAALGAGFRGQKVQIPAADLAGVKSKVLAAWRKVNPDSKPADVPSVLKRSPSIMAKKNKNKNDTMIFKRLVHMFKAAAGMGDDDGSGWAGDGGTPGDDSPDDPPIPVDEAAGAFDMMKAHHADLGKAIDAFGDASKLPADHPVHALKTQHKALGDRIAEHDAKTQAAIATKAAMPADGDGDGDGEEFDENGDPLDKSVAEPYGPQTGKPGISKFWRTRIDKRFAAVEKRAVAAEKRANDAEKIAKSERDLRELDGVKVELKKFDRLSINVDVEAPKYAVLKAASPDVYKAQLEVLAGANARIAKAFELEAELGATGGGGGGAESATAAWAQLEAKAMEMVQKGGDAKLTKAKALDVIMKRKENFGLVRQAEGRTQ